MICWRCGNELKQDDPYCKECGERANKKVKKKAVSAKGAVVMVSILLGSILLTTLIMILGNQKGQRPVATEVSLGAVSESVEDYQAKCKTYSYEELAKNPKQFENEYVTFTGQVVDVAPNGKQVILRVKVTPKESSTWDNLWEDDIYVVYTKQDENEAQILKHDLIALWGMCRGEKTYKTVSNNSNTIPYIEAKVIENKGKAEPTAKGLEESETFPKEGELSEGNLQSQKEVSLENEKVGEDALGSKFIRDNILTLSEENIGALFALDEELAKTQFGDSRQEYIFGGEGRLFNSTPLWASFEEEGVFAIVVFSGSHVYGLDFTESAEETVQKLGTPLQDYESEESGEISLEYDKEGYHLSIMFNENNDMHFILIKKNS